jgi:hypothetical protein
MEDQRYEGWSRESKATNEGMAPERFEFDALTAGGPLLPSENCAIMSLMANRLRRLFENTTCKLCHTGAMRPKDVYRGTHLLYECTNGACAVRREVRLPPLDRTVVYLDTSTISHIVRSLARGDQAAPYSRLYDALRAAVYANVIACVGSSIVRAEGELSKHGIEIARMSRELGDASVHHELHVREAQVYRAFGRYVRGEPSVDLRRPPREDAFEKDVNRWPSMLSFRSYMPSKPEWIEEHRAERVERRSRIENVYRRYGTENLEFHDIVRREITGFANLLGDDPIFYRLAYAAERDGMPRDESFEYVRAFLNSDHVAMLPVATINAKLHAAFAMLCRGSAPRLPKESDVADIDHVSTFAPYVDVLITDRFIAEIANQGHVKVAQDHGVNIRSLGASEVDQFIAWLEELVMRSSVAALSRKVYDSITAGGYFVELEAIASRYMANRSR